MTRPDELIYVRVTIKMQGVQVGQHVWVDPALPRIQQLLIGGDAGPYLVEETPDGPPPNTGV